MVAESSTEVRCLKIEGGPIPSAHDLMMLHFEDTQAVSVGWPRFYFTVFDDTDLFDSVFLNTAQDNLALMRAMQLCKTYISFNIFQ